MGRSASSQESRGCGSLISSNRSSETLPKTTDKSVIGFTRTISADIQAINQQGTQDGVPCCLFSMQFPSARGVVEMISHDGATVLLAATGHIRSFVAQRMNEDGESSPKANLAPITARIVAYPTGSAFESDWIVLERARLIDADLYTKLNEQNRRSMLVLDPCAGTWRVEDTMSLQSDGVEQVIGPILTKKAATALGETLDDVFELCRYPKELALAPNGTACAYRQMGRCPGACDGSESMDAYKQRLMLAISAASSGIVRWKQTIKDEIAQASAALEFELAQRGQRQLEQIEKLATDSLGIAGAMEQMSCVCITPAMRKGWAIVWLFRSDGLIPIVGINEEADGLEPIIERWRSPMGFGQIQLDRFALIARHWMTKPSRARRRRVTVLDLREQYFDPDFSSKLKQAIADACSPSDPGHEDEEHTHITG